MRFLGIKLTKHRKNFRAENCKVLMKVIKEDLTERHIMSVDGKILHKENVRFPSFYLQI